MYYLINKMSSYTGTHIILDIYDIENNEKLKYKNTLHMYIV